MYFLTKACAALLLAVAKSQGTKRADGLRGAADTGHSVPVDVPFQPTRLAIEGELANQGRIQAAEDTHLEGDPSCDGARSIPFAITNIQGFTHVIDGVPEIFIRESSNESPSDVYFLKNVRLCATSSTNYIVRGISVSSADEFKSLVKEYLTENALDAVLYNMHGFNVSPYDSFTLHGYKWRDFYQEATRILFIPAMWRSAWGVGFLSYEHDRNGPAIRGGKLFADHADVFRADYTQHMLTHSMGNWVYRNMAQTLAEKGESEVFFENHFMVAADARSDMFWDSYNPACFEPGGGCALQDAMDQEKEKGVSDEEAAQEETRNLRDDYDSDAWININECFYTGEVQVSSNSEGTPDVSVSNGEGLGIPVEECKLNGGYDITKLSNHIHVVWNQDDSALANRELFQKGGPESLRQALGKHGESAQSGMHHQYFRDRVTFHDLTGRTRVSHGYHMEFVAVNIYDPLLVEECFNTDCNRDICEFPYKEVYKVYCPLRVRYREHCCRFRRLDEPFTTPKTPFLIVSDHWEGNAVRMDSTECKNDVSASLHPYDQLSDGRYFFRLTDKGQLWNELCPNKLLQIPRFSSCQNERKIETWDYIDGRENQLWDVEPDGEIRNRKCQEYVMSIRRRGTDTSNREICIYRDANESHQKWKLVSPMNEEETDPPIFNGTIPPTLPPVEGRVSTE